VQIGLNSDSFPVFFMLSLAVIPALIVLLWVVQLLLRALRVRNDLVSIGAVFLILGGGPFGASVALDRSGTVVPAQVVSKSERVVVRAQGDWRHELTINVRYSPDNLPLPSFTSEDDALLETLRVSSGLETTMLRPEPALFDSLRPGDQVDLRILRVRDLFSLTRLAPQSTWSSIPPALFRNGIIVLVGGAVIWQFRRSRAFWLLASPVIAAALMLPLAGAYLERQAREDLSGAPLRATATVQEVTRITQIYPSGDSGEDPTVVDVPRHYDIVTFTFTPPGYEQAILSADGIDAGQGGRSRLSPGAVLDVAYDSGNPRAARIPDQSRSYIWWNMVAVYSNWAFLIALVLAVLVGSWLLNLRRRKAPAMSLP
jgi:hypothetical protein